MHPSLSKPIISFILGYLILLPITLNAQEQTLTRIRGTVIDHITSEPLPYVNISFEGTTIGTVSNLEGVFYLESNQATSRLKASFIGYEITFHPIKIGHSQDVQISLSETQTQLQDVVVSGKKLRYKNKDNPAVRLIKKVIDHKEQNHPKSMDYFEYDKYEKVEFDLNNVSEEFKKKRILKDFQLIFNYVDTSEVNGKTYLPVFLRETSSTVYYRKSPNRQVEYKKGEKMTGFEEYYDNKGISSFLDKMYQDIDIYQNDISILTQKFISPISPLGPTIYKYYIADTTEIDGEKLFKLAFQPRNEKDLAFIGTMFITSDSSYAVTDISLRVTKSANLNFVNDLYIEQEFQKNELGTYSLITDKINIDFYLLKTKGVGMFGKRTVSYRNLKFNEERDPKIYKGVSNLIIDPNASNRPDDFWDGARHMELSRSEEGVFEMVEEVKELPAFKQLMDIITFIFVGYIEFDKFEIGPVGSFYSWNQVEGSRIKFGMRTTTGFSEKYMLEGYGAYGTLDEEWKYQLAVTKYWSRSPINSLKINHQQDIRNPGEAFLFVTEDNFLLSIMRGINDKRFYYTKTDVEYNLQVKNGFSFALNAKQESIEPGGILSFLPGENIRTEFTTRTQREDEKINSFETGVSLRFAPNEQYYEGKANRIQIPNEHPIFTARYDRGFDQAFKSQYSYDKLSLSIFKRTYVAPLGYFDAQIIGRKLWGTVPYPLLNIPVANQTYSYQTGSYNLMNFLEFVSDESISLRVAHNFNGFILNKIPLIKSLNWRSIATFKGITGRLTSANDPSLVENSFLPALPRNSDGTRSTYPLSTYIETSFGISNIFKFVRIDLVKRWTQLDQPQVSGKFSVRVKFKVEF